MVRMAIRFGAAIGTRPITPAKLTSYMPAQHQVNQIPVPIFRMLGSDPVRQYDNDPGTNRQGVVTLEPVYKFGGGDSAWVNWYFKQFVNGESMAYAYTQAGQENSFTWDAMAKGFELQMPLIAKLRDEHEIKVETLAASGKWFKEHYKVTPATSVTVNNDMDGSDRKTVWFDSRFYRANLLWENGALKFRDIHLFNENFPSVYETEKATSNECSFFTLPVVDGYIWSNARQVAGLRFKAIINGKETSLEGGDPTITNPVEGTLHIVWPLKFGYGRLVIDMDERQIKMKMENGKPVNWFLDLATADGAKLPFTKIDHSQVDCNFQGMSYSLKASKGYFAKPGDGEVFRIHPDKNNLIFNLSL
jgi:hypothetical protein